MSSEERAIVRIRAILSDDKNYQTDALKLGGIWAVCDSTAVFRRAESDVGPVVSVELKRA